MYLGSIVELTTSEKLYESPMHPYTQALLSPIPIPDPEIEEQREAIPLEKIEGCKFMGRCKYATEKCAKLPPPLTEVEPRYFVACHLMENRG